MYAAPFECTKVYVVSYSVPGKRLVIGPVDNGKSGVYVPGPLGVYSVY